MSTSPEKRFDVLGLGCTAVDDLLFVPRFPGPDEKVQVERRVRRFGGLTGVALVAASRAGARCAYAGCLGHDELSDYAAGYLTREGVDVSLAPRLSHGSVVHSTVVVCDTNGSRNVFFEGSGQIGAHESQPEQEIIRSCRAIFIDQWGMPGNLRAARIARSAGVSVIADIEDGNHSLFREVLDLVDHLIMGEHFAKEITGEPDGAAAARKLWRSDRATVIVTGGANGCWSVSAGANLSPAHHPAFSVTAKDTTGCGDVFHGAYAASLAREETLEQRIRFGSAAAALKAQRGEVPRREEVQEFIKTYEHSNPG